VHIEETLSALTDLVRQGKVRYVGCSTFPAWAVMEAILLSEMKGYVRFATEQSPYNLLDRRIENELIPMAQKYGLGIITWSPLAMGVLAGQYTKEDEYPEDSRAALRGGFYADRVTKRGIEIGNQFAKLAKEAGLTSAQLGVLRHGNDPGRFAAGSLRQSGSSGKYSSELPQYSRLDERPDYIEADSAPVIFS